jgi:hypothetical protein
LPNAIGLNYFTSQDERFLQCHGTGFHIDTLLDSWSGPQSTVIFDDDPCQLKVPFRVASSVWLLTRSQWHIGLQSQQGLVLACKGQLQWDTSSTFRQSYSLASERSQPWNEFRRWSPSYYGGQTFGSRVIAWYNSHLCA